MTNHTSNPSSALTHHTVLNIPGCVSWMEEQHHHQPPLYADRQTHGQQHQLITSSISPAPNH
eukprot:40125-Eustigmatos_ZCMA.PRE.1